MENLQFIRKVNGKEVICDVICTYKDEDTNKDFIVFTDRTVDKNNKLNLYYSLYERINNNIKLIETTDIEDKKTGLLLIEEIINEIEEEHNGKKN